MPPARPASKRDTLLRPRLLYSDDQGGILDHPYLLAMGARGPEPMPLDRKSVV
jgi:hypothetical protein